MSNTYIRDPTGGGVGRGGGATKTKKKIRRYVHIILLFVFFWAPPPLLPLLLPGSKGIFKLISMHSLFPDVRVLLNRINHIVYDISYRRYY